METQNQTIIISSIERGMATACFAKGEKIRKCGEMTPFITREDKDDNIYHGFLSDWDGDCRVRFYQSLVKNGFKTKKYEADYYWTVENDTIEVSYVEGDVYLTFK